MRDVRDVDSEPVVPVRQPLDRDGIIEIASVLAVDCDGHHVAKIGAASNVALRHGRPETDRFGDRLW